MSRYSFITRQMELDLAVSQLSSSESIAVDTESSGFYTYYPELCLIQISSGHYHYVIDTLVSLKLDGLGKLFASPSIVKIFHAASSDITELKRTYSWEFQNIFDTMLACRMLGHESCSLASLVLHYHGVKLEKKEQKSNWKHRPLTKSQLDYANLDTLYLEEIKTRMEKDIRALGLYEELKSESDRIPYEVTVHERSFDENGWTAIPGALKLNPSRRAILRELYIIREERARKNNIAPFRLATNQALLQSVLSLPASLLQIEQLKLFHSNFIRQDGERIESAFRSSLKIEDAQLPPSELMTPEDELLFKKLKRWRMFVSDYRGMESSVVLSNRILKKVVSVRPADCGELAELNLMSDWKLKHYGETLIRVLHGKLPEKSVPEGLVRLPDKEGGGATSS